MSSYRKVKIPKQDWEAVDEAPEKPKISKEVWETLKEQIAEFADGKKINPHHIQSGLRTINFHKDHPEIYKIIEELCLDYDINGKEITPDSFVKYINDKLGDNTSRAGITQLYESLIDPKEGSISPASLHNVIKEIGDDLSEEDVKYIMETIAEPSKDYNIELDEFYYIMTRKPADVVKITKVTKGI